MILEQGVYNDKGYVAVRIWLGPKYNLDGSLNKPYRRTFGRWNNANIQMANKHVKEIRDNYKKCIMPGQEPTVLSFSLACDIFEKRHWIENPERSARAVQNAKYDIARYREKWRAHAFHSILPSEIEAYIVERKKAGILDSSIVRELGVLSSLFAMIDRWVNRREIGPYLLPMTLQGVPYNPVSYVNRPSTVTFKRDRIATDTEMLKVKIYCDAKDPDMLGIITRNILTGLRKTDLQKVNGLADVRGVLSKSREKKLFKFPLDFTRKLNYTNFNKRWNELREKCSMVDFHWHDWRHTSGTMLSVLGFSDEDIQTFYGHANVRQTRDYINRGKERLKPHVEALEGHLAKLWKDVTPPAASDPTMKVCFGCKEPRPLAAFSKHSAGKNGLDSRCRGCNYARIKERRRLNPELRAKEYLQAKSVSISNRGVGNSVGNITDRSEPELQNH